MPIVLARAALAAAALAALAGPTAQAQTPPDAGQLLRDANRAPPAAPPPVPEAAAPRAPAPPDAGPKVTVSAFKLEGVSLLPEAGLQAALAAFIGQQAGMADLRRAADRVAAHYAERGYLARAYLPAQTLRDGVVVIAVLEGRLGALRVEQAPPARRIGEERVRQMMLARQQLGGPVRPAELQRAIALLNALPGVSASSLLEPGDEPGQSRLVVAVKDEALVAGQAQLDNAGSKASGEWRASGGVSLNSPAGIGDQAQFFASKSRGSAYGSASYGLPVGSDGLRGSVNASRLSYAYTLSGSRYSGGANVLGAQLVYPLRRAAEANLTASAGHERKRFDNAVAGIQLNDKTVALTTLGLGGDRLDGWFGGGQWQFSLSLGFGELDLARNAADLAADQAGPRRQGAFRKLAWSLSRLQRITHADTLALGFSGQRAGQNLDSAEKFGATGPNGVRAYASSEPSGDEGRFASVEWRHQLGDRLTLSAYHERARLQRDRVEGPGTLNPNRLSFAGSGFGMSWGRASDGLLRAGLAWRHGANPAANPATGADSDGTRRNPRLYVSLVKTF